MQQNIDKFPGFQTVIKQVNIMKWLMFGTLLILGLSSYYNGNHNLITPTAEWATTFLYLNYFSVLVSCSPYYDSIHPYGKLVSAQ